MSFASFFARRDFRRAAALGWMSRLRAPRSRALAAAFTVSAVVSCRAFLTAVLMTERWARLALVRVMVCRNLFLAERILGTSHLRVGTTSVGSANSSRQFVF